MLIYSYALFIHILIFFKTYLWKKNNLTFHFVLVASLFLQNQHNLGCSMYIPGYILIVLLNVNDKHLKAFKKLWKYYPTFITCNFIYWTLELHVSTNWKRKHLFKNVKLFFYDQYEEVFYNIKSSNNKIKYWYIKLNLNQTFMQKNEVKK